MYENKCTLENVFLYGRVDFNCHLFLTYFKNIFMRVTGLAIIKIKELFYINCFTYLL